MTRSFQAATLFVATFAATTHLPIASGQLVDVVNLADASAYLTVVDAGVAAYTVPEADQGGVDLNGDGDTLDDVLHVRDQVTGATLNTGLAIDKFELILEAGFLAFTVFESDQGSTDLNGDGDTSDSVVHVMRLPAGPPVNVGLAGGYGNLAIAEGQLLFDVQENAHGGTDINGDGDAADSVMHLYDLATGTTRGIAIASYLSYQQPVAFGTMPFLVNEWEQGSTDLNGDGDDSDTVLYVYDIASGTWISTGHAIEGYSSELALVPGFIAYAVNEVSQGAIDLNGDGDTLDDVLFEYDILADTRTNLGLALLSGNLDAVDDQVLVGVSEYASGMTDLNGDGDPWDDVFHLRSPTVGATVNFGLALGTVSSSSFLVDGRRALFGVSELGQGGIDLNGDGDGDDWSILHLYDPTLASVSNLGLAGADADLRSHRLALGVYEEDQGGVDLNGDGDALDSVVHMIDLANSTVVNLGLATTWLQHTGSALFYVDEASQSADLNGDGDTSDWVSHAHDFFSGVTQNLSLAAAVQSSDPGLQVLGIDEFDQGVDLNGDGDTTDTVLHTVTPLYEYGLEADTHQVSLASGGVQQFELDAGSQHAHELHLLLGSVSGTTPGIPLGPTMTLHLNEDAYLTHSVLLPNRPPLANSFAELDDWGESTAVLFVPPGVSLPPGTVVNHAYVVLDVLPVLALTHVSNPVPLRFVP